MSFAKDIAGKEVLMLGTVVEVLKFGGVDVDVGRFDSVDCNSYDAKPVIKKL